ncbi:hypothetical protein BKA69DRAFT_1084179 [Paraphysoderma sedebokerense]|nr:hypothetical protein BKA69DRAFT_1084179 [Paraphysoderma sedebokerense]
MTSTVIMSPANAAVLPLGKAVTVQVKTNNLDLGFFDDPNSQYYLSPQTVNNQGIIEGHQHVSVQRLGNPGGQVVNPPDARTEALAFFKGLNDDSANGILSVEIPADRLGAPGIYRICTITGTRGHQPVLMPVAQRGSQDDCIRVTVN